MTIKEWFTTLPPPYFLTHNKNEVDISKLEITESGEVVLKAEQAEQETIAVKNRQNV